MVKGGTRGQTSACRKCGTRFTTIVYTSRTFDDGEQYNIARQLILDFIQKMDKGEDILMVHTDYHIDRWCPTCSPRFGLSVKEGELRGIKRLFPFWKEWFSRG